MCREEVWRVEKDSEQDEEEEKEKSRIMKSRVSRLEGGVAAQNKFALFAPLKKIKKTKKMIRNQPRPLKRSKDASRC